jgi:hypothetical protein
MCPTQNGEVFLGGMWVEGKGEFILFIPTMLIASKKWAGKIRAGQLKKKGEISAEKKESPASF